MSQRFVQKTKITLENIEQYENQLAGTKIIRAPWPWKQRQSYFDQYVPNVVNNENAIQKIDGGRGDTDNANERSISWIGMEFVVVGLKGIGGFVLVSCWGVGFSKS